jgi:hypothetical protein
VAELDRWLAEWSGCTGLTGPLLQLARDEIVALRAIADLAVSGGFGAVVKQARAEALEEAAVVCEARRDKTGPQDAYAVLDVPSYVSACNGCASDIRALKDKPA